MRVYKYRSNYNRDIKLLSKSLIFAPCRKMLNDPFEGLISPNLFEKFSINENNSIPSEYEQILTTIIDLLKYFEKNGIYSLSRKWNNELLWAHYSNSHKGYCIEYELDELLLNKKEEDLFPEIINVEYSRRLPFSSMRDLKYKNDKNELIKLFFGNKSMKWNYEQEVRVIFGDDGKQKINEKSIKSIIFGINASENDIIKTMAQMSNKINYFKIELMNDCNLHKCRL